MSKNKNKAPMYAFTYKIGAFLAKKNKYFLKIFMQEHLKKSEKYAILEKKERGDTYD